MKAASSSRGCIRGWILFAVLSVMVLTGLPAVAEEVASGDARQVAVNHMNEMIVKTPALGRKALDQHAISRSWVRKLRGETASHVFNFMPEGWVIVSGQNISKPILAYSTEGYYADTERPPAFDAWVTSAEEVLIQAALDQVSVKDETAARWERLLVSTDRFLAGLTSRRRAPAALTRFKASAGGFRQAVRIPTPISPSPSTKGVGPLLSTTWGQSGWIPILYDYAWNKYAPCTNRDALGTCWGKAPTGCVATAMAQIMKYHGWPPSGTGSHCYDHPDYGEQCADFGAATYTWWAMLPLTSTYEAAELLRHCGVAVDMDYGPDESGAYSADAVDAFSDYFQYDCSKLLYKSDYTTDDEWIDALWTDMDSRHPIYYAASDPNAGGHAFVCDGIDDQDRLHMNWGWGLLKAYLNGWYTLDLDINDPLGSNHSFSDNHRAIVGIHPYTAPTLEAGPDVSVGLHDQATTVICGEAHDDDYHLSPDGKGAAEFRWYKGSTPLGQWQWTEANGDACLNLGQLYPRPYFGSGEHTLTLKVRDCVDEFTDTMVLSVDSPPIADCSDDVVAECEGDESATVALDGSASYDPDGSPITFSWSSPTCTFDDPASPAPLATCPVGSNAVSLTVHDGRLTSDPCELSVTVVDTIAPTGSITFPAAGACLSAPVTIADDVSDGCSDSLTRTYTPGPGPTYTEGGSYNVTLEVADPSDNSLTLGVSFVIDNTAPVVLLREALSMRQNLPRPEPFSRYFATADDDLAPGGVVSERLYFDGCLLFDGQSYGNANGLLHDDTVDVPVGLMCRIYDVCGTTSFSNAIVRIEASDCAGNTGFVEAPIPGSYVFDPSVCRGGPAPYRPRR